MNTAQIETDARTIVNCLMSAPDQLPLVSACAVAGNAWQENLCRPVTTGPKDHGSDGMMQWRLTRLTELQRRAHWDTLPVQCQFFKDECKRDYPNLWAQLVAGTQRLETLTLNITDQYERPSAVGRVPDTRIGYARHVYGLFIGQPAPVPTPAPSPVTPQPQPQPTPEKPPVTDPTTTPAPAVSPVVSVLIQLFHAFGQGVATVVLDRILGKGAALTLPIPLPTVAPVPAAPVAPAPVPTSTLSQLLTAAINSPEFAQLRASIDTALTQGKIQ